MNQRARKRHAIYEQDSVRVELDGTAVLAIRGQSLLAVMVESGCWEHSVNLATGQIRSGYCGMGVCFECEVQVDDESNIRACMRGVEDGMRVTTSKMTQPPRDRE